MTYELTGYSILYFIAAFIAAAAAPFAWRLRRTAPGFIWLFLTFVAMFEWTVCDGMEKAVVELEGHILWSQISYFGATTVTVFLLLFAMEYTGRNSWINWRSIPLLFVIPVISTIGAFTNGSNNLVWTGYQQVSGQNLYIYYHGPLYWILTAYTFLMLAVTTYVLLRFSLRNWNFYRNQSIGMIVALAIPWVATVVYDAFPEWLPGLGASVTLAISGLILMVCITRFGLLDLVPVARAALVEHMADGLLVLDVQGRVVDCNPASRKLFGWPAAGLIGRPSHDAMGDWPELARLLNKVRDSEEEFTIVSPEGKYINFLVSPLLDKAGHVSGNLAIFRDITEHKETEAELKRTADDLHGRLSEIESLQAELREQAIRDPLTTLYNRRFLNETLQREFGRASREKYPISLVMLDIDHFKEINDEYGHAAGDLVLRTLGEWLRARTRPGDFACRYGGDEFLVVLPNASVDDAAERAESWRTTCEASSVSFGETRIAFTVSIGVAALPENGMTAEEVLTSADDAGYTAKAAGRNCVVTSGRPVKKAA